MEWIQLCGILGFLVVCDGMAATLSLEQKVSSPSYLISVPKVLRCGVPITLSVTVLTKHPITVTTELMHGNNSVSQTQKTIPAGAAETLTLPPVLYSDTNYWHPYELHVKGFNGPRGPQMFFNSTTMLFSSKCMSIFIQSDKNNYQPGQTVKFRVVSVTPDGKPYKGQIDIYIRDPRGNMIRQWLSVGGDLGVFSEELNLSQNPPQGQWKIVAGNDAVVNERPFTVEHYVLPRFEVKLDVPSVVYYEDTLVGTLTAKYFYGKPVSGVAHITYVHIFHGLDLHYDHVGTIEGSADVRFEVPLGTRSADYMSPNSEMYMPGEYIDISVNVTEQVTGLTYNSSARVSVVRNKYNLEFLQYLKVIKPSMTFTAQVKLSTYNHQPLNSEERNGSVRLVVTQQRFGPWTLPLWNEEQTLKPHVLNSTTASSFSPVFNAPVQELELPLTADGMMSFQLQLSDDVSTLNIEATFEDAVQRLQLYSTYTSPSRSYIQLHRTSEPQVGQPLSLSVESSVNLTSFHYLVMSRGRVVNAGTSESPTFSLNPDQSWTPLACVVVYFTLPDGEIVNDALQVTFTQLLTNTVSLSWSQDRAEPGDFIFLSASVSEPESLVGILVVDKAALGSELDNGITEKTVLKEFLAYSREMTHTDLNSMENGDPYSVFTNCGVTVLTDADLHQINNIWFLELPGEVLVTNDLTQETRERKFFPETWIWMDADTGTSTSTNFFLSVPDSLTTWVAFGVVMSETLGLGISAPVELTVFKDFFLSLNLPLFLIRGELLLLEVNVFNYMDVDLEVIVVVAESQMFDFVSLDFEESPLGNVRKVSVLSQNVTSVLFPILATALGEIPLSVKATSIYSSDLLYKTVLVKPEGLEQSSSQTLFLEFPLNQNHLSRSLEFVFPSDVVAGSQRASVSAVGDILGPSIGNLDSLVQMPYGCGEQNMIHFAPNIYVLQYLRSSGQREEHTRSRAMSFMMEAYERELSYQRSDGSFSAFGDSDVSGSTWLSAFVLRCFLQAREFISIDPTVIQRAVDWLVTQQDPDGSFREPGHVIHTELQGGLDGSVSLTAFVLISLLEDNEYRSVYEGIVSSAEHFLKSKLVQGISSNYSLCVVTYALSLANSTSAASALTELMNRAIIRDGVPAWSSPSSVLSSSWQPRSADIEMSAYVLLSMHRQARMDQGFRLMKWLSQQRNHLGGFGSTQDTVMALQALSVYAAYGGSDSLDLTITVHSPVGTVATFTINKSNYLLQQSQELPLDSEQRVDVEVLVEGKGFALFQLTVFYNVNGVRVSRRRRELHTDDAFYLYIDAVDEDMFRVNVHLCFSLRAGQGLNQTGMAILDVGLLSGFILAQDAVQTDELVRRVETPPGRVILYLNTVTTSERCLDIPTILDFKVTNVQDALVMIYDYYEPQRKTVRSYTSVMRQEMSVCSLCASDCPQCQFQDSWQTDATSSSKNHLLTLSLCAATVFLLSICN